MDLLELNTFNSENTTDFMQQVRNALNTPQMTGFFYIPAALKHLELNTDLKQLKRLDQLIAQYQSKVGPYAISSSLHHKEWNSLVYLASALGHSICTALDTREQWLNIQELCNENPEYLAVFDQPQYHYALKCHSEFIFPLDYLIQHFTHPHLGYRISEDIEILCLNLNIQLAEQTGHFTQEMQALETVYQMHLPLFCGRCFEDLLKITTLDYSLESLTRVDDLLVEIKQNYMLSAAQFIQQKEHRYFVQFIAAYVAQVIAKQVHGSVQWHHPDSIADQFNVFIPKQVHTTRIAEIKGTFFFVMQHVYDILFSKLSSHSTLQYATDIMKRIQSPKRPLDLVENDRAENLFLKQHKVKAIQSMY